MQEVVTFVSNCKKFEVTVKQEYTVKFKPEDFTMYDHFTKNHIQKYLHNPNGPAFVTFDLKEEDERNQYWLNGEPITDQEEIRKLKHTNQFNNKVDNMLNEDET